MNRLRLLTAGESHGPEMSGILDGLPAGLRVNTAEVNRDLARRQHGYGSGRRMLIEKDRVDWTAGLRFGRTLGSPLAFTIENLDWENWQERMAIEPTPAGKRPKPVTLARPGHADLAGAIKYDTTRHPQCARTSVGALDRTARGRRRRLRPAAGGCGGSHLELRRSARRRPCLRRR